MKSIALTPEQSAILDSARGPVAICRPNGMLAGFVSTKNLFTPEEIAAAEREAAECTRWYTTDEVLAHLRELEPRE